MAREKKCDTAANLRFETKLSPAAGALRGSMDAAEYKHVVLGLIFLIDGQIGHGETPHNDRHPDLKADFILPNPPFTIPDWGGKRLRDDKRWQYGVPAAGNGSPAIHGMRLRGIA